MKRIFIYTIPLFISLSLTILIINFKYLENSFESISLKIDNQADQLQSLNYELGNIKESIIPLYEGFTKTFDGLDLVSFELALYNNSLVSQAQQYSRKINSVDNRLNNMSLELSRLLEEQNSLEESLVHNEIESSNESDSIGDLFLNRETSRSNALEILENNPHDLEALSTLGSLSFEDGDLYSTEHYFESIVELEPDNITAFQTLGRINLKIREYKRAEYIYTRLSRLLPEDPVVYYNLSLTQFEMAQYSDSLLSLEKSIALDPYSIRALRLGGDISFESGNYMKAIEYLTKAVEFEPSPYLFSQIGDLYKVQQLDLEAISYWDRAIELYDSNNERDFNSLLSDLIKMSHSAFSSGQTNKIQDYFQLAQQLGGCESVYYTYLRSLKEQNHKADALKLIKDFEKKYPESEYRVEVSQLKSWAMENK